MSLLVNPPYSNVNKVEKLKKDREIMTKNESISPPQLISPSENSNNQRRLS